MNSLVKKILIIAIAIVVIVPAVYFSLRLDNQNAQSKNPLYYVPASSDGIGFLHINGTSMYLFEKNGSAAVVTSSTDAPLSMASAVHSASASRNTSNYSRNLSIVSTYDGITVFEMSNISLSIAGVSLKNITVYFADMNSFIVLGEKAAVMYSIDAYYSGSNAISVYANYINTSANISLHFNFNKTSPVSSVSLNYSYNTAYLSLAFNNVTYEKLITAIPELVNNVQITYLNGNFMKLRITGMNIGSLSNIIKNDVL